MWNSAWEEYTLAKWHVTKPFLVMCSLEDVPLLVVEIQNPVCDVRLEFLPDIFSLLALVILCVHGKYLELNQRHCRSFPASLQSQVLYSMGVGSHTSSREILPYKHFCVFYEYIHHYHKFPLWGHHCNFCSALKWCRANIKTDVFYCGSGGISLTWERWLYRWLLTLQMLLGDGEGKDAPWTVLVKMEMDSNGALDLLELEEWMGANAKWTECWMWFSIGSWVQTWCPGVWSETNQNQALGYRVRCAKGRERKPLGRPGTHPPPDEPG